MHRYVSQLIVLLLSATTAVRGSSSSLAQDHMSSDYSTCAGNATLAGQFICRCGEPQFLSLPHANITHPEAARKCAEYKLIDARGTNEPQGVSMMFYPMVKNILATLPGGVSLPVEYPAGVDQNTTSGEEFLLDTIKHGLRDCPHQKYALFGYSQGATLVLRTLPQLSCQAVQAVGAVILVGNPYHLPGKQSNVNAYGQHNNTNSVGMFAAAALPYNETIPILSPEMDRSGKVLDYCIEGDGVCALNPSCQCQLPAGHLSYGLAGTVQETAATHVMNQLRRKAS